jgi:hypothetical protein
VTFVVSYFTNDDESMFLAASSDGFEFVPLNDGQPVLRGEVGTGTLRDPFIGRGTDDRLHLLATNGWSSTSIVHASSHSVKSWSPQSLLPVMADVPGAKNAWAPEFFTDPETGLAHLIWSSVVEEDHGSRDWLNGSHEHRIWGTTTADFESFRPSRLFYDPGYSVIDATVQPTDSGFLMAFKDERGINQVNTAHKNIALTTFRKPWTEFAEPATVVTATNTPSPVEGPSVFRRGDEWILIFDHFLEGTYGALSSVDLMSWQPAEISLPQGMRHASVLRLPEVQE